MFKKQDNIADKWLMNYKMIAFELPPLVNEFDYNGMLNKLDDKKKYL